MTDRNTDNPLPLNPLGTREGMAMLAQQRRNTAILWGITVLLVILAAGVFFVLPNFVSPPDLRAPDSAGQTGTASPAASPRVSTGTTQALSPFEEAQRLRQRQAAQDVLAELLELQEELEAKGVQDWAAEEYASALATASQGDVSYREQQFADAEATYRRALDALKTLQNGLPARVAAFVATGNAALAAGDSALAAGNFESALQIDPDSDEAATGWERAQVLDEVLALLNQAEAARERRDYEEARDFYRSARNLDPENTAAAGGIGAMDSAIAERDFQQVMSEGYAALQAGNPTRAEARFERALVLRPGSTEATTALDQVRDQAAIDAISTHMAEARRNVAAEQWEQALNAWNAALAIDPAVVDAQRGRDEARSRLNLDNYLKNLISDPLALADSAIYNRSIEVYTSALRIPDGGPRLREQMGKAKEYLEKVRVPVNVTLLSDGETSVNLLRVEDLGQFSQKTLSLTPGRYAATGIRFGYKDVRVEFEVGFDGPPDPVTVAATESIR